MNLFDYLVIGVAVFIVIRALWYFLVEVPRGHTRDEAVCEMCYGKLIDDKVTEPLEWCECPQRETTDIHEEEDN